MSASYQPGQILTASELNASLNGKVDANNAKITGGQITGISQLQVVGVTDSTSPTTGALTVAGGAGIVANLQVGQSVTMGASAIVNGTTASTSPTTGALTVAGGAGVAGSVNVGGSITASGDATALHVIATANNDSTSPSTGTLIVPGGAGIGKTLSVGGNANVSGALVVTGAGTVNGLFEAANVTLLAGGTLTFADGSTQVSAGSIDGETAVNSTGGTVNISLSSANNSNIFKVTGALSSDLNLVFPVKSKPFTVYNGTTGSHNVICTVTGQTPSVNVPQGYGSTVFTDATGCYSSSSSSLTLPLAVSNGGTGATTATAAAHNLGLGTADSPSFAGLTVTGASSFAGASFSAAPTVPNVATGNNSTNAANTAFVQTAVSPFSGDNRIINGSCRVGQRGDQTHPAGSGNYSAVDRFVVFTSGSSVTSHQAAVSIGATNSDVALQITGASGNTGLSTAQRIESTNISDLAGQTVTVSFYLYYPAAVTPVLTAYTPNTADSWGGATTAVSGIPALAAVAANTWTKLTTTFTLPAAAANGLELVFNLGTLGSGQIAYMTRVKLESGSIATPFSPRSYESELQLCQRYYETGQQPFRYISGLASVVYAYDSVYYKVTKRAGPTVTGSGFQYYSSGSNTACTPSFSTWIDMLGFQCTGLTNWQGWAGTGTWIANAEL